MGESNGEKKTLKTIIWTVFLMLSTWALVSLVQAKQDIAVLQNDYGIISKRLESIENKLDDIIRER